jgi:hypothetical protein
LKYYILISFRYLQQLVTAQGARNRELEEELKAYRVGSTLQDDSPSTVTLDAVAHVQPNGTGKPNEKKKKRRGLVKKTRKVMTTSSDTTASLEREGDAEGEHDESSDAEAEAEVDFDEDGLMGMGMNMGAGIGMGEMGSSSFHGGDPAAAAAMSGMIGEMGMGMGMMSTMAAVMGGMGMVMSDGMRYGNGNGNGNGNAGARGRRAVRGSGPQQQQVEEIGESMEVDEESLRGRTSTRGSAAGSGVGTPACVGIDGNGKRPQNGIMTNGNGHPLLMNGDAASSNGTVNGSSTMRLKEERMDELLGGGGGGVAGIHMAGPGGGMGVGNMGVVGMEMMGMGMQA